MALTSNAAARKGIPLATGLLDYFPNALCAVAALSAVGNEQHNPSQPLHWDRSKSGDEADALMRHLMERGTLDTDGVPHSVKVAWRALALAEKELEGPQPEYGYAPEIAIADGEPATGGGESSQLSPAAAALIELSDEDAPTAHLKAGEANA